MRLPTSAEVLRWLDEMDFKGQALADRMYQIIILVFSLVAFIVGYFMQSFQVTYKIWLAGAALSGVLTLIPWPCLYRRNPVKWRESVDLTEEEEAELVALGGSVADLRKEKDGAETEEAAAPAAEE